MKLYSGTNRIYCYNTVINHQAYFIFSKAKDLAGDNDYTEIFVDQVLQVKNCEAIFEDFAITAYFAVEGIWDPSTLQEGLMEESPLGTVANYRSKVVDATMNYLACKQKWSAFHTGPLVQAYPTQVPPRKYISHAVAQSLKLPYTTTEAFLKFKCMVGLCKKDEWSLDEKKHSLNMKLCIELLELGAYCLPGEVIASLTVKEFVESCMKYDLLICLKNVRQGKSEFKK